MVSLELVLQVMAEAARLSATLWFERVPTASNVADGPSRGSFREVLELHGRVVAPVLDPVPFPDL